MEYDNEGEHRKRRMAPDNDIREECADCTLNNQYLRCTYVNKHVLFLFSCLVVC